MKAEAKLAPILNATNPDSAAVPGPGRQAVAYHGWNDQLISAQNSIDYYDSVLKFFGSADGKKPPVTAEQEVQSFYRLFMAPGMAHCSGGTGPNTFDMQAALEAWVERGIAPDQILATRSVNGVVDRSAAVVRVSQDCRLQAGRVHQRRGQLRVPRATIR